MAHDAPRTAPITDDIVDRVARSADVDPRSVVRRLAGLPVRGRVGRRIDRELQRHGLLPVEPANANADVSEESSAA